MSYQDAIKKNDMVNKPPHYNNSEIECIDVIRAATENGYEYYLQGVILKYLWRYRHKGKPIEDLKKAEWYLKRLIGVMQNKSTEE